MRERIGIVHPGRMGASVGAAALAAGGRVAWASRARSDATGARAAEAGLTDVGTVDALAGACDVIVSVCPPGAALEVAEEAVGARFRGIYVDANAVAPATARRIAETVEAAGARFVDGGIIGPPAVRTGTTRLYLSGADAELVAGLFAGSPLEAIALEGPAGEASALKMCYAAWTKGSAALLVAIRALAVAEDVEAPLLREWARSQAGLEERSERAVRSNAPKAWRFAAEMREIAHAFAAAGLPEGFHRAAADVYEGLAAFKDRSPPPELADAVDALLEAGRGRDVSNG